MRKKKKLSIIIYILHRTYRYITYRATLLLLLSIYNIIIDRIKIAFYLLLNRPNAQNLAIQ